MPQFCTQGFAAVGSGLKVSEAGEEEQPTALLLLRGKRPLNSFMLHTPCLQYSGFVVVPSFVFHLELEASSRMSPSKHHKAMVAFQPASFTALSHPAAIRPLQVWFIIHA